MKPFYYTLLLLLLCLAASAQPVVLSDPNQAFDDLDPQLTALEVKLGQEVTIDSLLQHSERYRFVPHNRVLNQQRAYWFRITLTNPTSNNFFLRMRNIYYDVMVYETTGKTLLRQSRLSRTATPGVENSRLNHTLVPLQVRDGQTYQVYLYVDHGNLLLSQLYGALALTKQVAIEDLCYGIFYGLVLLTALYSFLLFAQLGDLDNLIYGLWVLLLGFNMAFFVGHTIDWLGPWHATMLQYSNITPRLNGLLIFVFTMSFLSLRSYAPWLYRIGQGLVGLNGLTFIVSLVIIGRGMADPFDGSSFLIFFLPPYVYVLTAAIVVLRRGNKVAWYLLLGQLFLFVSILYSAYQASGLVPRTFWSFLSIHIGSAVEMIFFTLGLSYKVSRLKQQREEAVHEQLRLSEENRQLTETQKQALEEQVEQRTAELRASQAQLIQKEKLASLGELTAGIAHEIQNPLNFVNNFSEVSAELVKEIQEERQKMPEQRDEELETELLSDLGQNLEKITHHGRRASAIVKGMLEHSRTSTGEKAPTDLNALADEYLRLAYQGLKAKNKDLNVDLKTDFASDLGKIEVVPQDIGRVLLNLYNNAFYAVREKQKTVLTEYRPTVWVSTHLLSNAVEIRVKDNGTGIPEAIKAKISQPLFTTKPTGEGTGLGLSLSYDIVTKGHGGTLTVESEPGEFTQFVIALPLA